MPQIMPLNWFILLLFFLLIFYWMNSIIYFFFFSTPKLTQFNNNKSVKMPWMW
nr:ATP synthase F0 subunit 8 [Arctopsyche sp. XG-2022]